MTDYGKLMSCIWADKDFVVLNAREQQVFMMLFSFQTRNLAGVVPLTIRRWSNCTADATVENVKAALEILVHKRYIIIDWDTEEVLIRTYIRWDEVWKQPNLMVRCLKFCEAVVSEDLRCAIGEELVRLAREYMPTDSQAKRDIREATLQTAKVLAKTFPEGFQEGFKEPSANPSPEPFLEPFGEPPVVGGYLGEDIPPAPTPAPDTGTTTDTKPPAGVSKGVAIIADESVAVTETKRGTRLPEGWRPPDDAIRAMHKQFPNINLRLEHEKFCDYWHAKAGRDATKRDWVATWRNWIRGAAERAPQRNNQGLTGADRKAMDWMALGRQEPEQKGLPS